MEDHNTISAQLASILESFRDFYPEIVLASLFLLLVMADLIFRKRSSTILPFITLGGFAISFFLEWKQYVVYSNPQPKFLFARFLHLNQYEIVFKILILVSAILTIVYVLFSPGIRSSKPLIRGEFYALIVAMVLGLNLMVMSSNLLMVYLSIELVSIASYLLTSFSFDRKSSESGVKYILFGAFSSGIMLYGMSLIYGFTGSLQFYEPAFLSQLAEIHHWMVPVAAIMVLAGFLFKIAAVPFHQWTPDVYEGAPFPIAAFFSIAPKAAGIAVIINFTYPFIFNQVSDILTVNWRLILGVIAIVTMTLGNLAALGQNNVRRLLAYSSIAHAGFLLAGVLAFSKLGVWSVMFYLSVYLAMNFVAFILVELVARQINSEDVRNFKGLGVKIPFAGVIFVIVMIALTGLPPTAGFNAKFLAFSALWEAYQESGEKIIFWVFIIGLLNTVLALFYYLKIPYYLFFKVENNCPEVKLGIAQQLFLFLLTLPLLVLFFKPDWLMDCIQAIVLNF